MRTKTATNPPSTLGVMSAIAIAEDSGRTYADDEELLGGILDEVICAVEGPRGAGAASPRDRARRAIARGRRRRGRRARRARGGPRAARHRPADPDADALVSAHEPRRGPRPRAPHPPARRGPGPRRGSLHAAVAQLAADGTSAEELLRDARRGRGAPRPHRPPDRGAAAHDGLASSRGSSRCCASSTNAVLRASSRSSCAGRSPPPCRRCGSPTSCAP